jgi:hypothetical protein
MEGGSMRGSSINKRRLGRVVFSLAATGAFLLLPTPKAWAQG